MLETDDNDEQTRRVAKRLLEAYREQLRDEMGIPEKSKHDWISIAALMLSVGSIVWTGGVIYGQQQEHSRRIAELEATDRSREPLVRDIFVELRGIKTELQALKDQQN